jgi:nucleolar protein 56
VKEANSNESKISSIFHNIIRMKQTVSEKRKGFMFRDSRLILKTRCIELKCVMVTAIGFLFGEESEGNKRIVHSMWFDQEKILTKEFLDQFIAENSRNIFGFLNQITEEIISDNPQIVDFLRKKGYEKARFALAGEISPFRVLVPEFLRKDFTPDAVVTIFRNTAMRRTQFLLREKVEARDVYIAQAIKSIDDINSILNLIYARLSEWYGIHFPELQDLVRDNAQYIRLISKMKGTVRTDIDEELLSHLSEKRRSQIFDAAKNSIGAGISAYDIDPIWQLASFGVEILQIKDDLETYIDQSMKEIAPNIQHIVGSLLGARLIALAGSLESLAKFSAGTVQVLGAEKALFRHLRSGEDPPKHGVIFQSLYIHSAKKHQRGKIARALAGKLSIAARVDFFSGEFVGPTLLQDIEKRIEKIKSSFPEPSERQVSKKRRKKVQKRKFPYKKSRRNSFGKRAKKSTKWKQKT